MIPLIWLDLRTIRERLDLLEICEKIIFNSKWTKRPIYKRFGQLL